MKIVWLCHYSLIYLKDKLNLDLEDYTGHPGTWIYYLSKEFKNFVGNELYIISKSDFIDSNIIYQDENIHFYILKNKVLRSRNGIINFLFKPIRLFPSFRRKYKLVKLIRDINPDIINVHGTEHDDALLIKNIRIPVVIWIQGVLNIAFKFLNTKSVEILKYEERKIFQLYKCFITKKGNMEEAILKCNNAPIFYNLFYPVSNFCFDQYEVDREKKYDVVYIGNIYKFKGIEEFLKTLILLKERQIDFKACVVGHCSDLIYLDFIKDYILTSGLDKNIDFKGSIPEHNDVLGILKSSKILLIPALFDSAPLIVAESMAIGVPVIAYNLDGLPEMIKNRDSGILVEKGDIKALSEAVLELWNNPEFCEKIILQAHLIAKEQFYAPVVADKTLGIYKNVIENFKSIK